MSTRYSRVQCAALLFLAILPPSRTSAQELIDVLSYNVLVGGTSGGQPLSRTINTILNSGADVIGLQEEAGNTAAIAAALGMHHATISDGDTSLLSRYPITGFYAHGAQITLPLGRQAYVFNTHLAPYPYQPYDIRNGLITTEAQAIAEAQAARGSQIQAVMNEIASVVPIGSPLFFTGDFNEPSHLDWTVEAGPAGAELHDLKVDWPTSRAVTNAGLTDAYRTSFSDEVARPGYTWTPIVSPGEVHDRIDFVYHRGTVMQQLSAALVGEIGGPDVDIIGSNPYPSDHRAVLARYSVNDFFEPPTIPVAKGSMWTFAQSNLQQEWGKGTLHFLNDGNNSTQNATRFGTTAGGANPLASIPNLPDGPDEIMEFPGLSGVNRGFRMDHALPDNDGPTGGYMDSYTVVFDLYVDNAPSSGFIGLLNTNERNANAAEVWLDFDSSSGGFWREGSGPFALNSFSLDQWHRVGFVVSDSATLDIFVDGLRVADNVPWDAGDSIYTTTDPDPTFGGGSFSLLGDGTGFHGLAYLANLAFYDRPLDVGTMAMLGGASAEGIWLYLQGDANGDNLVSGADFTIWGDNFGMHAGTADNADGDFNGDGFVTGADFTIWADHFGDMRVPAESPAAVVPEPATWLVLCAGFIVHCAARTTLRMRSRNAT